MLRYCSTLFLCLLLPGISPADDRDSLTVGVQKDGRVVVPTNQILQPAGVQATFPGRPVDVLLIDGGRTAVVKNLRELVFLEVATGKILKTLPVRPSWTKTSPPGFSVVGLANDGDTIYVSDAKEDVQVARREPGGAWDWKEPIRIPAPPVKDAPHPAGLALQGDDLFVTATRANAVHRIDRRTGRVVQTLPVGVAPYTLLFSKPDRAYVSNWGGEHPGKGEDAGVSSGTPIKVDPRTRVASSGSVSVLVREEGTWKVGRSIRTGLHPSGMALSPDRRWLYVANANSDTVSVIDTRTDTVVETIDCRPEGRLPFGSGSNALAVSPDGQTLYVANGTNNCVAVVRLARRDKEKEVSRVVGLLPTGWYPGALALTPDGKTLLVANVKGHGSLAPRRPVEKGRNSHDHLGSVSIIPLPAAAELRRWTERVGANNRLAYSLAGLEKPRPDAVPVPVPARHGEPSVIQHVFYIIKENRTYDQVFGDLKEGRGEPKLCIFGEKITPNHHALAREFTLFDNFYCSGVLSADGHHWATAAYATDYLEKSFGGFTRSYPWDGDDPLALPSSGFLWDNALAHKKTLRNYGEFVIEEPYAPKGTTWTDLYNEYRNKTRKIKLQVRVSIKSLEPYTHPGFPSFPLIASDVYRAELFLEEFRQYEAKGNLPQMILMSLPCDHTEGTKQDYPTPRAMVADNDLALGRIVEAISRSRYWKNSCIFVVEDDPQNGFDHIDGHRTVALAISPYTRRKHVDRTCYNQTGMVKTIELMLGLPPMNQMDLSATAMRDCFTEKADLTPYRCRDNLVALDELNKRLGEVEGEELYWAKKSMELNLDEKDKADEDTLNRILWFAMRGKGPYPAAYAGRR
jgi:YVTN family beta-propeller protein